MDSCNRHFCSLDDSFNESPPLIKYSKTFDLGSESDLTEEPPMTDEGMPFPPESYMSPAAMPYFGVAPPSNIFNNIPERKDTFHHDTTGAPRFPDYLSDEDEMDLECCDSVTRGSIMILPRYSVWNSNESFFSLQGAPAIPSLYSSSSENDDMREEDETDLSSNCSTVPSLPCMNTVREERAIRRAAVGKKALLQRASSDEKTPSVKLNLDGAKAATFVAYAA